MRATHRNRHVEEVRTAIRTAFPGAPPERLLQAAFAAEVEFPDAEPPPEPRQDEGAGAEDEAIQWIDAIAQASEPVEEAYAAEIPATLR